MDNQQYHGSSPKGVVNNRMKRAVGALVLAGSLYAAPLYGVVKPQHAKDQPSSSAYYPMPAPGITDSLEGLVTHTVNTLQLLVRDLINPVRATLEAVHDYIPANQAPKVSRHLSDQEVYDTANKMGFALSTRQFTPNEVYTVYAPFVSLGVTAEHMKAYASDRLVLQK